MMRSRSILMLAATVLTIAFVTMTSRADDALADVVPHPVPFSVLDVTVLDAHARLTSAQREAAEKHLRAAVAEVAKAEELYHDKVEETWRARHGRKNDREFDIATTRFEQDKLKRTLEIERDALASLRQVLTPEQLEAAWPKYLRFRRSRLLLNIHVASFGNAIDLRTAAARVPLAEPDLKVAEPVIDECERDMDALVKRYIDARRQCTRDEQADGLSADDMIMSPPKASTACTEVESLRKQLAVEYLKACARLAKALSEQGRRAFEHDRISREGIESNATRNLNQYRDHVSVSAIARRLPQLSHDQRAAIKDLSTAAEVKIADALIPDLRERDAAIISGQTWTVPEERAAKRDQELRTIHASFAADVRALLTPEQLAVFDPARPHRQDPDKLFSQPSSLRFRRPAGSMD